MRIVRIAACLLATTLIGGSTALAQSEGPAWQVMEKCLAGPASPPREFMRGLNPALTDPDRVAWCLFLYVNTSAASAGNNNALFETWATDHDTFQTNPAWPTPPEQAKPLRAPILPHLAQLRLGAAQRRGVAPFVLPFPSTCSAPPCIGEEVRRNRATFDYIVQNKLFSQTGLAAFTQKIDFPPDSIEVKANWVPVSQLSQFLTNGAPANPALYHVNTATEGNQPVQYALVSFHIISKMVPNWTWATFEHMNNPGRCDIIGCTDSYGTSPAFTAPRDQNGTQYPNCSKTPALAAQFNLNKIDPAFQNYCLKGTQTDFTDAQGVATRLGNTVTEQGFVESASCITCHGRSAYSLIGGSYSFNNVFLYNSTPIGPIGPLDPGQFWLNPQNDPLQQPNPAIHRATDFVWSIALCAIDSSGKSHCSGK